MLEKYNHKVPRNKYKAIDKIKGTSTSKNFKDAYISAHYLMGLKAEALDAEMVTGVKYRTTKVPNGYKITCYGIAVKMNDKKYYHKLLAKADKEQNN